MPSNGRDAAVFMVSTAFGEQLPCLDQFCKLMYCIAEKMGFNPFLIFFFLLECVLPSFYLLPFISGY